MDLNLHNYGEQCRLASVVPPPINPDDNPDIPAIHAQFFYSSLIPIDDPLSSGTLAGSTDKKPTKGHLRAFSRADNNALEKGWYSLISEHDRQIHRSTHRNQTTATLEPVTDKKISFIVRYLAAKHEEKHGHISLQDTERLATDVTTQTETPLCCPELFLDVCSELQRSFCSLARQNMSTLNVETLTQHVMELLKSPHSMTDEDGKIHHYDTATSIVDKTDHTRTIPINSPTACQWRKSADIPKSTFSIPLQEPHSFEAPSTCFRPQSLIKDGITGKPFVRVGSPDSAQISTKSSFPELSPKMQPDKRLSGSLPILNSQNDSNNRDCPGPESSSDIQQRREEQFGKPSSEITVGISRLHMVSLPVLQMKPIYWSPVNDLAMVTRSTWFYRDTMLPVPCTVANQLEAGYHALRPYTQTWKDELHCAIDVGPLGEEKISHMLWPDENDPSSALFVQPISTDPYCSARCFRGEAAAEGSIEPTNQSHNPIDGDVHSLPPARPYANYHVIYYDEKFAFLLKPNLKPSAYYGRKPVMKIMKGLTVGIPVQRGFDRDAWEKLYEKKSSKSKPQSIIKPASSRAFESDNLEECAACQVEKDKGQVTELVLVAHGIGQKFAERVESFHFTHAINGFRRAINMELNHPKVREVLQQGQNGIMVLPVNWRHTLSFEDGGPMKAEDKTTFAPEGFGLKDIEPTTIPAVRSLISDVMFDIPFYMSHHKGKMIQALVVEANRVYRLWCRNNPGFVENGRVHIIAHSLGSVMALDVLSRQPTTIPRLDLNLSVVDKEHFEFDTKNLFLAGSPASFFLLLERGALVPRRGRHKPNADLDDVMAEGIVGEQGVFGCLAVDNIYNVLAKEDPIAYLLNGTIDPTYAASLKTAYVPSTAVSLLKSMGDAVRSVVPGTSGPSQDSALDEPTKPPNVRLPSQLELEVHNFSREDAAEKKAFLLNDNGQLDYYLKSGGGPLEMQYLNMLSAHSSYWYSQDFIRMLCMEIGRAPGKENTLPAMRAVKAAKRVLPNVGQ